MNSLIGAYFLVSITLIACRANVDKHGESIKPKKSSSSIDSTTIKLKEVKGDKLFASIRDTIRKAHLTKQILVKYKWQFAVAPDCI